MAIQVYIEKLGGQVDNLTVPFLAWQDDGSTLSEAAAITAVEAVAPTTVLGVPYDPIYDIQRVANSSVRVMVHYRWPQLTPLRPPTTGEERFGFSFSAPRKWVQWAPEIARFPATAPSFHGLVGVTRELQSGLWIDPPAANLFKHLTVPTSTVTASFVRTLALLQGCVNSTSLHSGTYAVGEIMLVSASGQHVSPTQFSIELGWSWVKNVSGQDRGPVTGVSYNGHDLVWDWLEPIVDRSQNHLGMQPKYTYVNRPHTYADLSVIGVLPP